MSEWTMTNKYPPEPGYYWALRENEYGVYVHYCPINIRDDMGGCWLRDAIGYIKIEKPKIPAQPCKPNPIISKARCMNGTNGCMVNHREEENDRT
jgi:hypothetical protein